MAADYDYDRDLDRGSYNNDYSSKEPGEKTPLTECEYCKCRIEESLLEYCPRCEKEVCPDCAEKKFVICVECEKSYCFNCIKRETHLSEYICHQCKPMFDGEYLDADDYLDLDRGDYNDSTMTHIADEEDDK